MKNCTLIIMAAGLGSRYGGGIKQLEPVGPDGEIIMDYSVYDAAAAGFDKIVFIIRHDIEADFKEVIGDRIEEICRPLGVEIAYAYQELSDAYKYCPSAPIEGRTKPLGTGQAILACDGLIDSPFAVINADDYYGKEGFVKAASFLGDSYGLVGYVLKNTLSDNGGVTRGICSVEDGVLTGIAETKNIVKTPTGAAVDGTPVDVESLVSMNFWCYPASFMDVLREGFPRFLSSMSDPMKSEYLLPIIADAQLHAGTKFTVLPTSDKWFGVTYKEDKPAVMESFKSLIASGAYSPDLFGDL